MTNIGYEPRKALDVQADKLFHELARHDKTRGLSGCYTNLMAVTPETVDMARTLGIDVGEGIPDSQPCLIAHFTKSTEGFPVIHEYNGTPVFYKLIKGEEK